MRGLMVRAGHGSCSRWQASREQRCGRRPARFSARGRRSPPRPAQRCIQRIHAVGGPDNHYLRRAKRCNREGDVEFR